MAIIGISNLQYIYSWTVIPPDNSRVTGVPDSTLLNRGEGYEVLAFLNRVCATLADALKAERMIRNHLPGNVRSHAHVLDWLRSSWHLFA